MKKIIISALLLFSYTMISAVTIKRIINQSAQNVTIRLDEVSEPFIVNAKTYTRDPIDGPKAGTLVWSNGLDNSTLYLANKTYPEIIINKKGMIFVTPEQK